jgi:hypothetical protein
VVKNAKQMIFTPYQKIKRTENGSRLFQKTEPNCGGSRKFAPPPVIMNCYKQTMTRIILIIAGLLIAGCDAQYGVFREANISHFIDHKCIERSLSSVKEVANIKYTFMGGQPSMTANTKEGYARHRYHYTFEEINGFVSVLTKKNGSQITQFSTANNRPPPQKNIDKIRVIMDKIEEAISSHCDIEDFSSLVEESCKKVECN